MTFDLLGIFRYSDPYFWSPFIVIGKDPMISFSDIRHSMLDQAIDEAERLYVKENCYDPLNPPSVLPNGNAKIILNFNIIYSHLIAITVPHYDNKTCVHLSRNLEKIFIKIIQYVF